MVLEIEKTKEKIGDLPFMKFNQALFLDNLLKSYNLRNLLELGFLHGTSSCYLASILKDMGGGHLTTIDLKSVSNLSPNINQLLELTELTDYVSYYFEDTSYNWRLMKLLEENDKPIFDFCYVDGAHDWFTDGFAFLLVDKLLKPGGWIVFNDLFWTFGSSPGLKNTSKVQNMPHEEKETPHVKKIFDLLVRRNPDYHNCDVVGDWWGIAQKKL